MNTITKTALVAAATLMACTSTCEASFVRMGLNRDQMPVDIDEVLHANFDRARRLQAEQMQDLQFTERIVLPGDDAIIAVGAAASLSQKDEDEDHEDEDIDHDDTDSLFLQVIVPEPEVAAVPEEVVTNPEVAVEVADAVAAVQEEAMTDPDVIPDAMSDVFFANDANEIPSNETLSDGFQSAFFNIGDEEDEPEVADEEPEDIAVEVVATNPNDGDVTEVVSAEAIVVVEGRVDPTVLDDEASSANLLPNSTQATGPRGKLDIRATEISFMIIMDDFRYSNGVESMDDIKIGTKFGFTGRIATKAEELGTASGSCTVTSDIKKEMSYCDIYHKIDTDNFGGYGSVMVAGTADEVGGRLLVTGTGGSLQSTPSGYAMIQFDPAGNPVIYVLLKLF